MKLWLKYCNSKYSGVIHSGKGRRRIDVFNDLQCFKGIAAAVFQAFVLGGRETRHFFKLV
jgi:hypothetical protein